MTNDENLANWISVLNSRQEPLEWEDCNNKGWMSLSKVSMSIPGMIWWDEASMCMYP